MPPVLCRRLYLTQYSQTVSLQHVINIKGMQGIHSDVKSEIWYAFCTYKVSQLMVVTFQELKHPSGEGLDMNCRQQAMPRANGDGAHGTLCVQLQGQGRTAWGKCCPGMHFQVIRIISTSMCYFSKGKKK